MIEKILSWCGTIFAVLGIIFLFVEAITCLRRKTNTKLTIVGMVMLSLSVIGYLITELILREKDLPVVFSFVWIALLWGYLICNLISACSIAKKNRASKLVKKQEVAAATTAQEEQESDKVEEEAVAADSVK